ncbi:hypothetical protein PF005_g25608 [Phytophthora fragariae]|uniref:Uncharacterized protein n=1 Tax=Phytophthora fragariae TaxID=53985 RepID=A0A6A3LFJ3_9STRA|nr:hypothetical protein PF011_g6362 [Phytophthora fragariae]KAE9174994.1 hypothetical protein PF005_g25608 [Phytophthora fragariae]
MLPLQPPVYAEADADVQILEDMEGVPLVGGSR